MIYRRLIENQIHIDLVKFANKFEVAYEIIKKWYLKETDVAVEWKELGPVFMETGGYYFAQSVVGYKYSRAEFYPYTKAYLETANYLKGYMKKETDLNNLECKERLFLPMCYLYRNCVELSLKTIWFEEIGEDFQTRYKVLEYSKNTDEPEYIEGIVSKYIK